MRKTRAFQPLKLCKKLSLPGNKQKAPAAWLGVLGKQRKKALAKEAEKAGEAERKQGEKKEAAAESAEAKTLEARLSAPEVLDALAEKVSGRLVPLIQKELGGNPAVPQHIQEAPMSDAELALKVFDMLEAGSSFVDVMGELKLRYRSVLDLMDWYGKNHAW